MPFVRIDALRADRTRLEGLGRNQPGVVHLTFQRLEGAQSSP